QQELKKAAATAEAATKRIEDSLHHLKSTSLETGKALVGAFGFTLSIEGIIRAFETLHEKTIEEERSLAQLNATLRATGNAAGFTAKGLEELSDSLRIKTVFDDDAIRQAETALLRFRGISHDTFEEAIRLAPDLATVLGVSLPQAATTLGRALTDPAAKLRELRDAGVRLSERDINLASQL